MRNVHLMHEGGYRVSVDVAIADPSALWSAAMLAWSGSDEEGEELLGTRDAPDAEACLQFMITPARLPGCIVHQSSIERRGPAGEPQPRR